MSARTAVGFTPVTQRIMGWPEGECVRACYAALFDLPMERVPRFDPASLAIGEEQRDRERKWLAGMGLRLREVSMRPSKEEVPIPEEILAALPQELSLLSGRSPRGFGHRCVGVGGELLWDPHPSRAGLITIYAVGYLVPAAAPEAMRWF